MPTAQGSIANPYVQLNKDNPNNIYTDGRDARNRRNEVLTAGAEFDADLSLLDYQNLYNSPSAKAQRMREAGLNPDLLGISDVSDSSGLSGLTGSASVTPDTYVDPVSRVSTILSTSSDVLNSALDTFSKIQGIRGQSIDSDLSRLNLNSELRNSALDFIGDHVDSLPDSSSDSSSVYMQKGNPLGLSKRSLRRYRGFISDLQQSFKGDTIRNKVLKDNSDSRYDLASSRSRFGYKDNYQDMFGALKAWNSFLHDCDDIAAQGRNMKGQYEKDYYSVRNGVNQAYYDNLSDKLNYDSSYADYIKKRNDNSNARAESIFKNAKARLYQKLDSSGLFGQILMGLIESGSAGKAGSAVLKKIL